MSYDWDSLAPLHSGAIQPSLFKQSSDDFVTDMRVSIDEMKRWQENEWLSFDPVMLREFDEKERIEVLFIKSVVRFGLSDSMVNRILSGLDKPYCYDPKETFFSFEREMWITLPPEPDPIDTVSEGVESLIESEEWEELTSLKDRISECLENNDHAANPISNTDDLDSKLKALKFQEGNIPGSWSGVMDGIHFSACLHPLKGLAISYSYVTSRTACQDEVFIPKESSIQDIAQALVEIHDKLIPKHK